MVLNDIIVRSLRIVDRSIRIVDRSLRMREPELCREYGKQHSDVTVRPLLQRNEVCNFSNRIAGNINVIFYMTR